MKNDEPIRRVLGTFRSAIREDLRVAVAIEDGKVAGIKFMVKSSLNETLTFRIADTYIWKACLSSGLGWQIADLVDGQYINRRGVFSELIPSLNMVLAEQEKEEIREKAPDGPTNKAQEE